MRRFLGLVFMGAGEHSRRQCDSLHQVVDHALSQLSGNQQRCHCDRPNCPCEEQARIAQEDIEEAVRDVAAALLGREVTFGERLPYPWSEPDDLDRT